LTRRVLDEIGGDSIEWRDGLFQTKPPFDAEVKGVDFLRENDPARTQWLEFWPQTGNVPSWDAVGVLTTNHGPEWLLVEAKANLQELRSSCTAKSYKAKDGKEKGGLNQIKSALQQVQAALAVDQRHDWLSGYYQYCNRLAVLHFLRSQNVAARLLFVYFTGDTSGPRRTCPSNASGWKKALERLDAHVGLPAAHPLADRIHRLFLPVMFS
jgi:hypothetical protein